MEFSLELDKHELGLILRATESCHMDFLQLNNGSVPVAARRLNGHASCTLMPINRSPRLLKYLRIARSPVASASFRRNDRFGVKWLMANLNCGSGTPQRPDPPGHRIRLQARPRHRASPARSTATFNCEICNVSPVAAGGFCGYNCLCIRGLQDLQAPEPLRVQLRSSHGLRKTVRSFNQ